jgi:hypothetical protein
MGVFHRASDPRKKENFMFTTFIFSIVATLLFACWYARRLWHQFCAQRREQKRLARIVKAATVVKPIVAKVPQPSQLTQPNPQVTEIPTVDYAGFDTPTYIRRRPTKFLKEWLRRDARGETVKRDPVAKDRHHAKPATNPIPSECLELVTTHEA